MHKERIKELYRYLIFGIMAFVVNMLVFYIFCKCLKINPLIGNVFAWIAAMLFAFFTNKMWVFNARKTNRCKEELITFALGRGITLGIEEIILLIGITFMQAPELIPKLIGQIVVVILNYIISKKIVF